MGIYRRTVPVPRRAVVAGVNGPFDLGVNPISYFVVHLDGVVAAVTPVGHDLPWADLDRLSVLFNGAEFIGLSGEDLRAMLYALGWRVPYVVNHASAVNGDLVRLSIPVPFSRVPFWTREGFPATRKGELQVRLEFAAQGATFQSRNFQIETVEVLDLEAQRFLKYVTKSDALVAGQNDLELAIGNDYAGILIFNPAVADAGFGTGAIGEIRLLVDNVEFGIANSLFDGMRDLFERKSGPFDLWSNGALPQLTSYAFVDFDPLRDDSYLLPTVGRSSVMLRFEMDNAGTVRAVPLEVVRVPGAAAAGTP